MLHEDNTIKSKKIESSRRRASDPPPVGRVRRRQQNLNQKRWQAQLCADPSTPRPAAAREKARLRWATAGGGGASRRLFLGITLRMTTPRL